MGWDLTIGASVDLGGPEPFWVEVLDSGYTFNIGRMFGAAGVEGPRSWDGLTGGELLPVIEATIAAFRANADACRALNPANGWASYSGALEWFETIAKACRSAPQAKVSVT